MIARAFASALGRVVAEPAGKSCPAGGQAFEFGVDANRSGALDVDEVKGTSYVCNGSAANAEARPIPAGDPRCPNGGTAFTLTGGGGTPGTTQEVVVCNGGGAGAAGARGPQGDAGPLFDERFVCSSAHGGPPVWTMTTRVTSRDRARRRR